MTPIIAIVGRPNVGKSTLFNCLTKSQQALVADIPGVTRDRLYGEGRIGHQSYIVVDTGGMIGEKTMGMEALMTQQTLQAINEADIILFVVDAKSGVTPADQDIVRMLRPIDKPIYLVVNKLDDMETEIAKSEFYALGFASVFAIAAAHRRGIITLMGSVLENFSVEKEHEPEPLTPGIKIAIVGRPNVGKSTLINRMLGEERVLVFDQPGTTRDSIFIPFERDKESYVLIDTAGVRRRGKIDETIEKFSVIKTLQAIKASNVVIFIIDAQQGVSEQDLRLLDFIIDAGKALVIAVNKWDGLSTSDRESVKQALDRRLGFVSFARIHFISALHGSGVGDLFGSIHEAYSSATRELSTPELTRVLQSAIAQHQPPLIRNRRIKLRYAHAGGQNPPIIVLHGNQVESLPIDYQRYLINVFRKHFNLIGTPIRIELKSGSNPFKGRKNIITPRQIKKRSRLLRRAKK